MSIIRDSKTDPNKILPMRYMWARKYYQGGIANNWVPEEVSMQRDVEQWKTPNVLTPQERHMILLNLGFFSTAESLTANNLVLAVYRHVTNPECRQYLLRQAFEEAVHTDTFIYCCDTLGLNPDEIYNMYQTVDVIKKKDDFVVNLTKSIFDPQFDIVDSKTTQQFIHDLIGYYVIMEGIFFYAGFAMMLSLRRHNKMVGIGQQFEYIMRDESIHLAFGCDLINTIKAENPEIWTKEFQQDVTDLIKKAVELEIEYAIEACPNGLLGITSQQFIDYVKYIADRRLERIDLQKVYFVENPFPWMSQSTDLSKEKNFFETRVIEYQSAGSLDWEE
ncbi:MAG: ribonucleotide-diphosphate reductase subunit beta [Candidatus Chromulinivorax sp.]